MEVGRIISAFLGNSYDKGEQSIRKQQFNARFYVQTSEDEGETIFCKNNVCVFHGEKHYPGYFTLKACTVNEEYTRLILHWTSNGQLQENMVKEDQRASTLNTEDQQEEDFSDVFHIDLIDMKVLKFFFDDDNQTCGHFVIGNHENHYKVFYFQFGAMNHLVEILDDWALCKKIRLPAEELWRKKCFAVIPVYSIQANQSFEESRYSPMNKSRFGAFFNASGQLEDISNFRKEVFFGGILPEVRDEAWPFLLHYYPFHSRTSERKNIKAEKTKQYLDLNERRLNMPKEEYDKFWLSVQCTVDKDVVRTDRSHPYFAGNDNPNVEIMRNILLNYAYHQPEVGYNQGMSDLVASILSTVQDEVDAFCCFVGLMEKSLFVTSPKDDSIDCQLLYLKELLRLMEVKFYAHLLLEDEGMDLLFCHRWLLLGFKREFHDLHVLRMWEASWSHYQTEFFHIFLCVAIVSEYGEEVWKKSMRSDEMINYFNNIALNMDGERVLRKARSLLHQFRALSGIPCTLRGLLSGPGVWDSATLPEIECSCHDSVTCKYSTKPTRGKSLSEEQKDARPTEQSEHQLDLKDTFDNNDEKLEVELTGNNDNKSSDNLGGTEGGTNDPEDTSGGEYETCNESPHELAVEVNECDEVEEGDRNSDLDYSKSEKVENVEKKDLTKDEMKNNDDSQEESHIELYVSQ